jgi:hypothetical protein
MYRHYERQFGANVAHLAQQRTSKLRGTVTEQSGQANSHVFKIMSAAGAMTAKTAPAGTNTNKRTATPYADQVFNNRVATSLPYGIADSLEWDDVVRMANDPASALTAAFAAAVGRRIDDTIIAAATGAALDDEATSNSHPAGSQIGGASTAFSFDLVRETRELVLSKDIDPDEMLTFVVSPDAVSKLLDEQTATSFDYVNAKALMSGGIVNGWMGFNWIVSNRLTDASPTSEQRYGLAYTKRAIGLFFAKQPFARIAEDPGVSFATTVYAGVDVGAVRVLDTECFRVHYLQS